MSGKRIVLMSLLLCCLVISGCSTAVPAKPNTSNEPPQNTTGLSDPAASAEGPIEYPQKTEYLPDIKSLTTFPGVLESMSMTLEQIIKVLGNDFDVVENHAQGLDTYKFHEYDISLDFDKVSKKILTILLDDVPYYVYSGEFKVYDLDGDGNDEKIIAYEDQEYNGKLLILDGGSTAFSETKLGFFGSKCYIELLSNSGPDKENLVLVKNRGGNGGDILKWSNGKITSILPHDYSELAQTSMVTIEGDKAIFVNESKKLLYICPLPDRAVKAVEDADYDLSTHRFHVNLQPSVAGDSVFLKARTGLQILLSKNYNFIDNTEGTYCDVAQATVEYQYLGQGKWQEQSISGGAKYENLQAVLVSTEDLSIDGVKIYDSYDNLDERQISLLSDYTAQELEEGVVFNTDGLSIGITWGRVTYLSLDEGNSKSTSKGLNLTDTREKVLSLYGLPDKGFMDDSVWTYYVVSEEKVDTEVSVLVSTLNIEFDGENLCRIWMSSYVTAF